MIDCVDESCVVVMLASEYQTGNLRSLGGLIISEESVTTAMPMDKAALHIRKYFFFVFSFF